MTELKIMIVVVWVLLVAVLVTAVFGVMYPDYVTAAPSQTEIPVKKLKCTDIRDGICVEWTEYKIVRH